MKKIGKEGRQKGTANKGAAWRDLVTWTEQPKLKYIAQESKERLNDSPEFGPKNEHSFMRATDHSP
jgi:hypothetical protein